MQCACRERDTDRIADREPARVVDQVLVRPHPNRIAIKSAGIGALHDLATQDEAALGCFIRRPQPRILTAEVRVDLAAWRPGDASGVDFDGVVAWPRADRD